MSKSIKLTDSQSDIFIVNDIYSTQERIIGKWIDGKPIYRKTFTFTRLNNSSNNEIGTIAGINNLVHIYGVATMNSGKILSLPHSDYDNNLWNIGLFYDIDNKKIYVQKGAYGDVNGNSFVIVEYTKTTD